MEINITVNADNWSHRSSDKHSNEEEDGEGGGEEVEESIPDFPPSAFRFHGGGEVPHSRQNTLEGKFVLTYWNFTLGRGKTRKVWGEWHLGLIEKQYNSVNAPKTYTKYNFLIQFDEGSRRVLLSEHTYGEHAETGKALK